MSITCNFSWKSYDIASCIGAPKPSGNTILGLVKQDDPLIPALQTDFVPPAFVADLIAGFRLNEPLFIFGPTGCAKTAAVRWLCSKFHLPLLSVTGHNRLEYADLIGHYTVTDGTLSWVDGPLLTAIRYGCVFCFDELTLCPPETLVGLHGILDRHPLCVPETNELIPVHPQFRFVATDNTNGAGDETGQYTGTLLQNQALMNRCFFIKADFLAEKQELALLKAYANNRVPEDILSKMIKFAGDVRSPARQGSKLSFPVTTTISIRDLRRWIDATDVFSFLKAQGKNVLLHALERAVLYRLTPTDRATLVQLFKAIFDGEQQAQK